ncbi:MAG TPA: ABC transporter ATP-binding protein [Candidatus Xenobia bacterium]
MSPVLQASHLRKVFDEHVALDDLSFVVEPGEVVGLLGPNGAGKSTAIQILLGLTKPTSGQVTVFGLDLERDREAILQRCNFTSAYTSLPPNLTVQQNLVVFAGLYGVSKSRVGELAPVVGIEGLMQRKCGELSSGESTRVNLCKALLNDPELLYLDEPTASLDPNHADKVRKLLQQIRSVRPMAMLYTSHNMKDVEELCDRVLFLHRGKVMAEGTTQQVLDRFQQQSLEDVFIRVARSGDLLQGDE